MPMQNLGKTSPAAIQKTRLAPGLAFFVFVVLAVLLPYFVATRPSVGGETSTLLCIALVVYSAARISLMVLRGTPQPLALGFQLFLYPFIGLSGLAQVTSGVYPLLGAAYANSVREGALLVIIAGVASHEFGYFLASLRQPILGESPRVSRIDFHQTATVILGLFGIAFLVYTIGQVGIQPFFTSRDDAAEALAGTTGQVYALEDKTWYLTRNLLRSIPVFVALVATLVLIREKKWRFGRLGRLASYTFLSALVCANVVSNNPLSNSRFWFGSVILTLVAIYLPWRTERGFRVLSIIALSVFIFVFGLLDAFRRSEADLAVGSLQWSLTTDESYSAVQTTLNGYVFTLQNPPMMGGQLITAILTFVPRSIWPSKGVDTGSVVDSLYNRAATLWTEFSVDFGLVGVVVGFAVYGIFAALIDQRVKHLSVSLAAITALAVGMQVLLLRGSLVTAMTQLYSLAFFFGVVLIPWSRHRVRSDRRLESRLFRAPPVSAGGDARSNEMHKHRERTK